MNFYELLRLPLVPAALFAVMLVPFVWAVALFFIAFAGDLGRSRHRL